MNDQSNNKKENNPDKGDKSGIGNRLGAEFTNRASEDTGQQENPNTSGESEDGSDNSEGHKQIINNKPAAFKHEPNHHYYVVCYDGPVIENKADLNKITGQISDQRQLFLWYPLENSKNGENQALVRFETDGSELESIVQAAFEKHLPGTNIGFRKITF